jgi:hypothetical protein
MEAPRLRRSVLVAVALALAAGLAALVDVVAGSAETLARGELLDYTNATVSKVRVLDSTLYFEQATDPSWDLVNALLLVGTSSTALFSAALMHAGGESRRRVRFFAIVFLGAGWLALDEMFGIHETVYYNLEQVGVSYSLHVDNLMLVLYAAVTAAVVVRYHDLIALVPAATRLVGAAAVLGSLVLGMDLVGSYPVEEALELPVSLLALAAIWKLAAAFVAAAMRRPRAMDA